MTEIKSPKVLKIKSLKPFNQSEIRVLLLEGLNPTGIEILTQAGYQVECHSKALSPEVLKEKIQNVHAIGIRYIFMNASPKMQSSKTQLTADVLKHAKKLLAIGCFCIGTNQVDLEFAAMNGIAVFNSPFSNSRSVAELMIAQIIMLSRQLGERNNEMHQGVWNKSSKNCREIRGKCLGIVGYGHIGTQLSVLAEAMGMNVYFYDILQIMPLGTAKPLGSLEELLATADFITLHVPETPETVNMISARELALMKKGSYLINASRGSVVDIPALSASLKSGHLAGSAVDVFPIEPFSNGPNFTTELRGCPNTILTPHIGGSTEEAQSSIGVEVANALVRYINYGSTLGAVNFPEAALKVPTEDAKCVRIINCHRNVPGVLKQINLLLSEFNIEKQICDSKGPVAYVIVDINADGQMEQLQKLYFDMSHVAENIMTRILY